MKRIFAAFSALVLLLSLAACEKNNTESNNSGVKENVAISETYGDSQEIDIQITAPEKHTSPPVEVTEKDNSVINVTVYSDTEVSYKKAYADYINAQPDKFKYNYGESTDFDPVYTYIDLDNDGVDELIYFLKFKDSNTAKLYFLDINGSHVFEFFGTDYCGNYRTSDQFRIFEPDGQYYIIRHYNDGLHSLLRTVYKYDGKDLIPLFSIAGSYHGESFCYSDAGLDAFYDNEREGFISVSEAEFDEMKDDMYTMGDSVYYSNEVFERFE